MEWLKNRKANRFTFRLLSGFCVWIITWCAGLLGQTPIARADVPAITDFGQETVQPVFASENASRALFLTFYQDGRHECVVRTVQNDSVVSFAGEHPSWTLDHSLSLFVRMPVYIRVVHELHIQSGTLGV